MRATEMWDFWLHFVHACSECCRDEFALNPANTRDLVLIFICHQCHWSGYFRTSDICMPATKNIDCVIIEFFILLTSHFYFPVFPSPHVPSLSFFSTTPELLYSGGSWEPSTPALHFPGYHRPSSGAEWVFCNDPSVLPHSSYDRRPLLDLRLQIIFKGCRLFYYWASTISQLQLIAPLHCFDLKFANNSKPSAVLLLISCLHLLSRCKYFGWIISKS